MSVDPASSSATIVEKLGLEFPLLSDELLEVIKRYGVADEENQSAWPAIFLIGRDGRVAWRSLSETYKVRAGVDEILAATKPPGPQPSK